MAAPGDSGYGLGEKEQATTVDLADVKRQAPKVVGVPDADGEVKVSGEDEQVAKKPRVEKAENGGAEKEAVEEPEEEEEDEDEEEEEEEEETVEELNGAKAEDEVENGAGEVEEPAAEEEEATKEATDAATGDGGLKSLLKEGEDAKKSAAANHGADAAHILNGAK